MNAALNPTTSNGTASAIWGFEMFPAEFDGKEIGLCRLMLARHGSNDVRRVETPDNKPPGRTATTIDTDGDASCAAGQLCGHPA